MKAVKGDAMKTWDISNNDSEWEVLAETARTQSGIMTISPGEKEGGPDNKHPDADQWLLVLDGAGEAVINGDTIALKKGSLLLIEAGDLHEIRAAKDSKLRTINFYGPPVEFDE